MTRGALKLSSGEFFPGLCSLHQHYPTLGEVIFNTGMTGYVESLTDPSYAGQILVFTYPLLGNYGVPNPQCFESKKMHVKGVIFSTLITNASHYDSMMSLGEALDKAKIPYMTDVDTRALTLHLRMHGALKGAISISPDQNIQFEAFEKINWVKQVSIKKPEIKGQGEKCVIAVDCGMKENIMRCLMQFPIRIKRVPYDYDYADEPFDGILLSNGPGDPAHCQETIRILKKAALKQKPIFGICLGTQLMALAFGAKVYKLSFGHHAQNQPCLHLKTRRAYLTTQNHGYAIDEKTLSNDWEITFRNLNDGSVEGMAHKTLPFFSVQFHPEASPGPMDTQWLFQNFYDAICKQ